MRFLVQYDMSSSGVSSTVVLLASGTLLLSGLMQLATAWMQMQHRAQCRCEDAQSSPPDATVSPSFEDAYTWIGEDYPTYLPLDLGAPVALTLEDSRHYALDTPDADAEYLSIYPGENLGFVRLGPHKRFFSLSMYHQMHCLDSLRHAILGRGHHRGTRGTEGGRAGEREGEREGENGKRDVEHSQHCLNYLRQTVLCAADLTLEPEVVEGSQEVGEGLGVTHVCRDWSKVHAFVERNYVEWEVWKNGNRSRSRTAGG